MPLNEGELNDLLKATEGATKGKRGVIVTPVSVSLHATDENCLIYRTELDPLCLKQTHDRQIADVKFHAAFDPTTCAELVREVLSLRRYTTMARELQQVYACDNCHLCKVHQP